MEKELIVIGMSPGNGYFKQDVIDQILSYSLSHYKNIEILIPDVPAIATYVALGYPENIARGKKAIPQGNSFRNRISRSIKELNLDVTKIHVLDWEFEAVENNVQYQKEYSYLKKIYESSDDFANDINNTTSQVLIQNPFKKKDIDIQDVRIATHYILSEFAYMLTLPYLRSQYSMFFYGYHNPWPVWEKFIKGVYDGKPKYNLGFIKLPNFSTPKPLSNQKEA